MITEALTRPALPESYREKATEKPDYVRNFLTLDVGEIMELPASLLRPSSPDEMLMSYTEGPIEVYPLQRKNQQGEEEIGIWIADGNHRFFRTLDWERAKAGSENKAFDPSMVFIKVMRVVPYPDNDIRVIHNATEWKDVPPLLTSQAA